MKNKLPCSTSIIASPFQYLKFIVLCFALLTPVASFAEQSDFEVMLQALLATTPHPAADAPEGGTFYTIQHIADWPPLPTDIVNLPFWDLGDNFYLLDDREYVWETAEAEADGGGMMTMTSANSSSSYYGSPVYFANFSATPSGSGMTISFSLSGGTNNVPYDILMSTNLADNFSQWIGIA